ncbi:DUF2914 domain-containing protein [Candidatus Uhrbacteria bacterium]|nr:DUF2914 domain-containing protein [Candidatus Uhrbacteria bacterium]
MFTFVNDFLRFRSIKRLYVRYERFLVPGMLLLGVLVDVVTFRTIQIHTALMILGLYAVLAGIMIGVIHWYDATNHLIEKPSKTAYLRVLAPLIVQFTFGALLSASLIFYWFSGSFAVSWPFILLLIFLMGANDVFREYYLRPFVQLSVYAFILFSVLAVALPFVFHSLSAWVFILAGGISAFIIFLYLKILFQIRPDLVRLRSVLSISISSIFLLMNVLYFLNIIPPIPLSLTDSGVYHFVERSGSLYLVSSEQESFLDTVIPRQTIHTAPGERVYVFTSIFAPLELNTEVVHHWQRYEAGEGWVSVNRLNYSISGGRQRGYRGYSYITHYEPGKWRVDVETARGQVIGRVSFSIEKVDALPSLIISEK